MADNDDRAEAARQRLLEQLEQLVTGEEWTTFLTASARFHRYSPNNQLLLAAQGAVGWVASYRLWGEIPAEGGGMCQVARDASAVSVFAPMHRTRREIDDTSGTETVVESIGGYRAVPVFHEGQLVRPPVRGPLPRLLDDADGVLVAADWVEAHIIDAGFTVEYRTLDEYPGANGLTDWTTRTVAIRPDLPDAHTLKVLLHELAHVTLDHGEAGLRLARAVREVEAESVAFIVGSTIGLDSTGYSLPYVAHWSGGDITLVRSTAERVLRGAKTIIATLDEQLHLGLTTDLTAVAGSPPGRSRSQPEARSQPVSASARSSIDIDPTPTVAAPRVVAAPTGPTASSANPSPPVSPRPGTSPASSSQTAAARADSTTAATATAPPNPREIPTSPVEHAALLRATHPFALHAFDAARTLDDPVAVYAELVIGYHLDPLEASLTLRCVGAEMDQAAVALMSATTDPASAVAALRDTWPQLDVTHWVNFANQFDPDVTLTAADLPTSLGRPAASTSPDNPDAPRDSKSPPPGFPDLDPAGADLIVSWSRRVERSPGRPSPSVGHPFGGTPLSG